MELYSLNCRKKNRKYKSKAGLYLYIRIIPLSKCIVCDSKKPRFIKKQEAIIK